MQQIIEQKSVVLIGYIGCGKTTIFNKCCKKNQQVACGGKSITRNTYLTDSAYGNGFKMLDTPGFGSFEDKIGHAVGVLNALAEGPINRLLIVIKLERIDLMTLFLKPIIQNIFRRFKQLITVIVTNWDQVIKEGKQIEQTRKNEIQNLLLTYNLNSIIYSGTNTTGEELCQKIDSIIYYSKNQKIELTETEFYNYFDLIEVNENIEDQLRDEKEKVKVSFKKKTKVIKTFITNFDENDQIMTEIMHALSIEIKSIANQTIEQFERQNNPTFSKLYEKYNDAKVAYLIDSQLKLELMDEVNQVIKLAQQKMKNKLSHFFNYIKRCPNCNEVWMKVSGCNGKTQCGNFPDIDEIGFQSPFKFKFFITETQIKYEYNQNFSNTQIQKYKFPQNKRIGCGVTFDWSQLPNLNIEATQELLDPGILDYLAEEIPKEIQNNKSLLDREILLRRQDLQVIKI